MRRRVRQWGGVAAGLLLLVAGPAVRAACPDQAAPSCNEHVDWSDGAAISWSGHVVNDTIPVWTEENEADATIQVDTWTDCDNWGCCGECPDSQSGVWDNGGDGLVGVIWEVVDGPDGWQYGTNCWLSVESASGGTSTDFSATLPGEYTIRGTASDTGPTDECGGGSDGKDPDVEHEFGVTVVAVEIEGPIEIGCGDFPNYTALVDAIGLEGEITGWRVSDTNKATITEWGALQPLETGTFTITVDFVTDAGTFSASIEVTIVE